MKNLISIFVISCLTLSITALADDAFFVIESEGMKIKVEKVAEGFGVPWAIAVLSSNELLITEREGSIKLINLEKSTTVTLKNTPDVFADGQGGMLDVALAPNFNANGWIYFTYVKSVHGEGATVLARAKLDKQAFSNWQELLVTESTTAQNYHFGSRITFDNNNHVYFGVGDRGKRPNSQDLSNHAGTIMRLNLDGTVPDDNPFNKKSIKSVSALTEIWSYGHRNPQGMAYDFENKRLWSIEHGPRGGDEINLVVAANNYGWPLVSHGKEYWGPLSVGEGTHREGITPPVKVYIPSIAPSSLILYTGDAFPEWKGNLLAGALKLRHINRIVLNEDGSFLKEERLLEKLDERIRALTQSPEGWLYFSTDSGKLYRISPYVKLQHNR
ncbi:MAG: PQQ-dependent sugar dehydrogenase [Gammaproteobacteria bacterium]|nr:PQQ-dependent sugar dehydrogenase [Gammaproteobacteria bacterium]